MRLPVAVSVAVLLASTAQPAAAQTNRVVEVGGGSIEVSISGDLPVPEESVFRWIETAGRNVAGYLGHYPVPRVRLSVRTGRSGRVGHGVTYGGRMPLIRISVGNQAQEDDFRNDWVLTHEMAHLSFPDLTSDDRWAEEGLATYVESVARARSGMLTEERMWLGFLDGMPKGLPRSAGDVLHENQTWGRTYWGGALFWLLADVGIREKTENRKGLADALRGISAAGGDIRTKWSLKRTLDTADRSLNLTVLRDLYGEMGEAAGRIDLRDLWSRLGVRRSGATISYDDRAPLAAVRRAIVGR